MHYFSIFIFCVIANITSCPPQKREMSTVAQPIAVQDSTKPKPIKKRNYDKKAWTNVQEATLSIVLDIKYATTDNFTKTKIYDCPACYLRPAVATALAKVHAELQQKGLGIKVFDCYRPRPYQQRLWDKVPDPNYVTPPKKGSMHNRGMAIDLTIIDKKGNELDMGTPYDFFGEKAHHTFTGLTKIQQENRTLLLTSMEKHGFKHIRTEWWHYSFEGTLYDFSDWLWECN
jgi:zinc D-Ala-D-Ala dipeptidase